MHLDVWSDVVCPWCYLGKRRLERALEQLPWGEEVTVRWRAYQLDPGAGPQPGDLRAALERKYGPGAFDAMTRRLGALGAAEGIDYRFDLAVRVGTTDAHRLLAWAWDTGGADLQGPLKERLLRAYFSEGANVADHATLASLAADVGLDAELAGEVLGSGSYGAEVAAERAQALDHQITGVPAFVIEQRALVPGAQEVDTFVKVLERAHQQID